MNLSNVTSLATGGQPILAKVGLYALCAIVCISIGTAGGYKLGVILQKDRDKEEIDGLVTKLTARERADVISAKSGQDGLTHGISDAKEKEFGSNEDRAKILAQPRPKPIIKIVTVEVTKEVPGAPPPPVVCSGLTAIDATVVNQLLEKSNETGFYLLPATVSSGLQFSTDPSWSIGSAGSNEINFDSESPAGRVCSASEVGGKELFG